MTYVVIAVYLLCSPVKNGCMNASYGHVYNVDWMQFDQSKEKIYLKTACNEIKSTLKEWDSEMWKHQDVKCIYVDHVQVYNRNADE